MRTARPYITRSFFWLILFAGTFGAWAFFAQLQGAVMTTGELIYTTGRTIDIPHQDGGTLQTLYVEAGDTVEAGDILAAMDPSLLDIETRILIGRQFETQLRDIRLQALLDGTPFPALPTAMQAAAEADPDLVRSLVRERAALQTTQAEWAAMEAQYVQEARGLEQTIATTQTLITGLQAEETILARDFETQRSLFERGITTQSEVSNIERNLLRVRNSLLQTQGDQATAEIRLETLQTTLERERAQRRSAVAEQLAQTAETLPEIEERLAALEERRTRLAVRAPVNGVIDELRVAAEGVVVLPGSLVATMVPRTQAPTLVANIQPAQIDQVRVGQAAMLRPMTRSHNDMELRATVNRISEGLRTDPITGMSFYQVTLDATLDPLVARGFALVSGTPFEIAIQTEAKSPLEYFLEPVARSFRRALRE